MNGSKHQKNFNEFAWLKACNLHFIMIRHSYGKGGRAIFLNVVFACCLFSQGRLLPVLSTTNGFNSVGSGGGLNTELAKLVEILFPFQ